MLTHLFYPKQEMHAQGGGGGSLELHHPLCMPLKDNRDDWGLASCVIYVNLFAMENSCHQSL